MKRATSGEFSSPLVAAVSQLKVSEETGANDGVPAERYMRGDKLPWCAGFVLWCFDAAITKSLYTTTKQYYLLRNVKKMENEFKRRGLWFGPALVDVVQPSDIIFFGDRGASDAGRGRHVGIVDSVEWPAGIVHTIEGNTSNKVQRREYKMTSKRITGYARAHV